MIESIESHIIAMLQSVFDRFGWWGVAGMMAFENATTLTPSEIVLGLAGWMLLAAHGAPVAMIVVGGLYAALGSVTGSSLTYWLARLGGRPVVDRVARWFRIDPHHITRAEKSFRQWGPGLVLLGRMVPGLRTLITIPAGLARMPFLEYVGFTFIGSYLWCTLLIGLGYAFGHEWPLIRDWARPFMPWLVLSGVCLIALTGAAHWLIQRRPSLVWAPVKTDED